MELLKIFLNLITFPLLVVSTCLLLPPYLILFKLVSFVVRSFFPENVKGMVVLVTGSSSGIGEHVAYEYARRGACLALAARREDRLREVAEKAKRLGCPDTLVIPADVSDVDQCQLMIQRTIDHFGRVDHLVNNAGINSVKLFEDYYDITSTRPVMDVNFWGSVYTAKFAMPHLRKSKGKMIVISSSCCWSPTPLLSVYNASKAAMTALFETLRVEVGRDINITIVMPGFIESEITKQGRTLDEKGFLTNDIDRLPNLLERTRTPVAKVEGCAKGIVKSACRGDRYLITPLWMLMPYCCKLLFPELLEATYSMWAGIKK